MLVSQQSICSLSSLLVHQLVLLRADGEGQLVNKRSKWHGRCVCLWLSYHPYQSASISTIRGELERGKGHSRFSVTSHARLVEKATGQQVSS